MAHLGTREGTFGPSFARNSPMPYTLWSRGRLLGESALSYERAYPLLAVGDFEPSEVGERLMPIILGVGPAVAALADVTAEARRAEKPKRWRRRRDDDWPEGVRQTTEYADALSAHDELESLQLEIRDASGALVPTEWIHVQDAYRLAALGRQLMEEDLREMGEDPEEFDLDFEPEPWQPPLPRYQIMVALAGHERSMKRMVVEYERKRRKGRRG